MVPTGTCSGPVIDLWARTSLRTHLLVLGRRRHGNAALAGCPRPTRAWLGLVTSDPELFPRGTPPSDRSPDHPFS
jgi:hypothetical protein